MVLTVSSLVADIKGALHGAEPSQHSCLDYINMAGHHLYSAHDWSFLFRRAKVVGLRGTVTISDGTWTESTKQLESTGAFADYTWVEGDEIRTTGGTDVLEKTVRVVSRVDDDTLELAESISATAGNLASADIEATLDLLSLALPEDFGAIMALDATDSLTLDVHQTTLEELLALKTNEVQVTSSFYYAAIVYANSSQAAGETGLVPLLEIWPAPPDNDPDAFSMFYRAGWVDLTDDNVWVPLPAQGWMDTCFRQLVRAFARGFEHEQSGPGLAAELAEWEQARYTQMAMERDGSQQQRYGPLAGGAVGTRTHGAAFTITTPIAGPS